MLTQLVVPEWVSKAVADGSDFIYREPTMAFDDSSAEILIWFGISFMALFFLMYLISFSHRIHRKKPFQKGVSKKTNGKVAS